MEKRSTMTSDAKRALAATIRGLRARLLEDLHGATESAYRLSIRRDAETGLPEVARTRRRRLLDWQQEQVRAQGAGKERRTAEDFRREAEKQAAYTLLNRLVMLRLLEAKPADPTRSPLRSPALVTGGYRSRAYLDFRQLAPALVRDETEGYAYVLRLVFEDLATELPGLFGPARVAELVPIPPATLRAVIDALDDAALESCWRDDMTLGWVYQYWNDPEREALDAKLNRGGKVAPHEIASKTQMFTERYMVDWLLQNSLGPMWLAMCRKHGWTAEVETRGILRDLDERRADWRAKREAGEVSLTELMPLHSETERRWAYYVPQPIPDDAVARAPESWSEVKILDPAVGSGHFLVVAMDLLVELYLEEARHRGLAAEEDWQHLAIVERILSHNLHGIDLDPRAVQIAAAALWLKAQQIQPGARPERLNLVASNLRLGSLPDDDPALVELRLSIERETGIPGELTDIILHALRGADHLGSLLKIDQAVDEAIEGYDRALGQRTLFDQPASSTFDRDQTRATLLDRLEAFLSSHSRGDDLGLRLWGEQLAAGVRFLRLLREGSYDLVVANPPYQGTSKMADAKYVAKHYKLGKADLFAAFLLRGLELVREGGVSGMLTMRNWMFIKQYAKLRKVLLEKHGLTALGDFDRGAFEDVPDEVVSVAATCFCKHLRIQHGVALCPTPREDRSRDALRTARKRAATLAQVGLHEFDLAALKIVPEWPVVYWWQKAFLNRYAASETLGSKFESRAGLATQDNPRYLRKPWETSRIIFEAYGWAPLIKGGAGREWLEPLSDVIEWRNKGLQMKVRHEFAYRSTSKYIPSEQFYFRTGVAFCTTGSHFSARAFEFPAIFTNVGSTIFTGTDTANCLCVLNNSLARKVLSDLNPSIHFELSDIARLPYSFDDLAESIFEVVKRAFVNYEYHREPSVEFKQPGPSPWRHAQQWAQEAVDRSEGAPLPPYEAVLDPEPPTDHLSFALGVALGRFGPDGEGILDPSKDDLSHALPAGLLFLDGTLDENDLRDGLGHDAAKPLHAAWTEHGPEIETKRSSLRDWLRLDFFSGVHRTMYEHRPIHWPLSSTNKTFVAWVNIHRMNERTLGILRADHLRPALIRFEGELADLIDARDGADKKASRDAENRYERVKRWRDELADFLEAVEQCGDRGPLPTGPKCPEREQDARYAPDLDDGVMINSSALWAVLEPQWKDPKTWWHELASAEGRKDYDWSHLAMRYWPTRVDEKCREDPSLAVAHGCFWRYHPERAWAWELRLQDEIGPDFRIEEEPYRPGTHILDEPDEGDASHRRAFLGDHPEKALEIVEKEALRRMGRGKNKQLVPTMQLLDGDFWSRRPDDVWELEIKLADRQDAEFHLEDDGEAEARAAYEAARPEQASERRKRFGSLELPGGQLGELQNEQPSAGEENG